MGNKMVYVEETENGTTSKKIVEVENKVLEVASSDTSLSALSTDTIETEITDGVISSELKKGSVSTEYLSSDLQQKIGQETLPLKKLFLRDRLPRINVRISNSLMLKGGYDISRLAEFAEGYTLEQSEDWELETTFKCGGTANDEREYVKIVVAVGGDIYFFEKNGGFDLVRPEKGEWGNEDYTKIQIQYDTEITPAQQLVLREYFDVLYDAEDIIVINRDKVGYDFTPMLISTWKRNHTNNYGGRYTAKSLFSRRKRIGYNDNKAQIPARTTNMTLFDLLEWFGILSEGNSDKIWYRKNEIKEFNGSELTYSHILGFQGDWTSKSKCEKYYIIPLRSSFTLQDSQSIVEHTILNSDILKIQLDEDGRPTKNEFVGFFTSDKESGSGYPIYYSNFYVTMGVGKVEEKFAGILRYSIQDICRVSVRMDVTGHHATEVTDLAGNHVGTMIISFKGSVEK